ncbi:MAG: lysophospholipid acyltransferase family protein [Acidimicrobiales bacterium]
MIRGASWAGARTPAGVAHRLATVGGNIEWAVRWGKRRHLAVNLAHAVAATGTDRVVRRLVRREIVNEAHRSADLLWALGRREEFLATLELDGIGHARAAADVGAGLILLGTHLGGWEVATAVPAATLPVPTNVIVADDWIARGIEPARRSAGLRVVHADRGALQAVRVLQRGEALLLLGDDGRFASRRRFVRFLDAEAEIAGAVAWLSRSTQAPVVGFSVLPLGPRRWRVIVDPPLVPPAPDDQAGEHRLLQDIADRWSEVIRQNPEHWAASFPIRWRTREPR